MIFFEDISFYIGHRISHINHKYLPIYQYIHKWHHEYSYSVSIANQYAHPLEHLLVNVNSSFVGAYVLGNRMHVVTFMIWGTLRMIHTHDGHSGYEFPWNPFKLIPFAISSEYHDWHHSRNVGNYCSMMSVWDSVFNTN